MPVVTLADLVTASTPADALALELSIATSLGLDVTAWQPVSAARNLYSTQAQVVSNYSQTVAYMAQGGYASFAAQMVDANGAAVTSWLDLRVTDQYNITRFPASGATGPVPVTNTSGIAVSYSANNPLHFANVQTGASYTSTGSGTIIGSGGSTVIVTADAQFVGSAGTSAAGVTLQLVTTQAGVTVLPLTTSLVGSDAETNAALLLRGQSKLATLSPNGSAAAYYFVATSIPVGTPSASPPYAVSALITRASPQLSLSTGTVNLVIANAGGAPSGGDIAVVNAAIQNQVVPNGVTATVQGATSFTIAPAFILIMKSSAGRTAAQALSSIGTALGSLFANLPIGGYNSGIAGFTNYVPYPLVLETIMNANPGTVDCALVFFAGSGGGSGQLAATDVPTLGTISGAVSFIP